jgi:hypothetical protein
MNLKTRCLLAMPACLALASNLSAGVLPILNGSFEAETIDNTFGDNIKTPAAGGPTGMFTGWGASSFTSSFGSVSDSTALFTSGLTGTNSYRIGGVAFQNTGHTFTSGVTYTLSVDVGRTLASPAVTNSGMSFGFRKADNSANVAGTTFAGIQAIPVGTFQTFTYIYTALPADQGNPISIRLTDFYSGNTDLRVDNVRLTDNTVGTAATLTTLSASPASSSIAGLPVTLSATVTSTGTPDGTVTFYDGANSLGTGTLNGSGIATLTTTAFSVGNRTITATYEGSVNFLTSTSAAQKYRVLESIALQNPGFEEGAGYLGGTTINPAHLPGWQLGGGGIYNAGAIYGDVSNQTANFTSGLGGTNAIFVGGGRLVQTAAGTFETGRTYTFSIEVGNPTNAVAPEDRGFLFGFRNGADTGYLTTSFIGGATVAAIPSGTFRNFRLTYKATAADNGNPIQISIEDYFSSVIFYRLDNVAIGISPDYATWANDYGLAPGSESVDSDLDGISNLLEYAQNSSPVSNKSGVAPTVVLAAIEEQNYLRLTTVKNPLASELTYLVQSSPDLVTWSADDTVIITNSATSLVVRDAVPQSPDEPKRFLRLQVSQ